VRRNDAAVWTGIGLGALVALGWWRASRSGPLGWLGLALPAWLTGKAASESAWSLTTASYKQVGRAAAGAPLTDYRQAEDASLFWQTASNDGGAYLKTAYWLAVASRLARDRTLAASAAYNQNKGQALISAPGGSYLTGNVSSIYADAAARVSGAASGNRQVAAIATLLGQHAGSGMVAGRKQVTTERSVSGQVKGGIAATGEDVGTVLAVVRGVFSGERPPGWSDTRWFMWKWGLRVGILAALGIGVWAYTGGPVRAARRAAAGLAMKGSEALGRAHARLGAA
jgi:hypothetical protein